MKETLTEREHQVMHYLSKGYSNQEIASTLGVSITTIKTHLRHIFNKLHAESRLQAVYKYQNQPKSN